MLDSKTFVGKNILIIGASSGIGRNAAVLFSELGARCILVALSEEELGDAVTRMDNPERHIAVATDLTRVESVPLICKAVEETGEKLDGLVYCAGIAKPVPLRVINQNSLQNIFQINYFSFMQLAATLSKKKYMNDSASILALSAVNVHYPQKCMSIYAGSKAALEASIRTMSIELYENRNIRINAIIAGPVQTPMSGYAIETDNFSATAAGSLEHVMSDMTPNLMGMAMPRDITNMIAVLMDNTLSGYITGRAIYVDGGKV